MNQKAKRSRKVGKKLAWFAPTAAYPHLTDLLVSAEDVRELRKLFGGEIGHEREHKEALGQIHRQIVAGLCEYLWAFRSLSDVVRFIYLRRNNWLFQPFPHPETISEYALNALYQRFPFDATVTVDWLVFHGEEMWWDPRSDAYQAGSMVSEIGDRTPRRYWYAKFGFDEGLYLVAVNQDQPFYRVDEARIERVWKTSADVEPEARRQLMQFLKTARS